MGGVLRSRSSEPVSRPTARRSPHKSPSHLTGAQLGGARWDAWRTRCPGVGATQRRGRCASSPGAAVAAQPTERSRAEAALRPTCHQAQRLARRSSRCEHLSAPLPSAARLRVWRVTGVAIWPAPHRAKRPASQSVRQAGLVHAQREGIRTRDPWARERAAACLSRLRRPDRIANEMNAPHFIVAVTPTDSS